MPKEQSFDAAVTPAKKPRAPRVSAKTKGGKSLPKQAISQT
jgi:hypothetical protein